VACASLQHLHAVVAVVGHDDAPVAVDGDAGGKADLPLIYLCIESCLHLFCIALIKLCRHVGVLFMRVFSHKTFTRKLVHKNANSAPSDDSSQSPNRRHSPCWLAMCDIMNDRARIC
jgi:hypothetical protein